MLHSDDDDDDIEDRDEVSSDIVNEECDMQEDDNLQEEATESSEFFGTPFYNWVLL